MVDYVDPNTIFDPTAQDLTNEELKVQMQDSFRMGRHFIKSKEADPIIDEIQSQYLALINSLDKETGGKYSELLGHLREHFKPKDRPLEAFCVHLFTQPDMVKGVDGKEYPIYGWAKLRGEFETYGDAETEIGAVMRKHDTYTRTALYPKGVFFPLTAAPLIRDEKLQERFEDDIQKNEDLKKRVVEMERKREQIMKECQQDAVDGSIEDYVTQKLRCCVADTKIQRGKMDVEKFTPIYNKQAAIVAAMETEHPNYVKDGLKFYQDKMDSIGFPRPQSFYDGALSSQMT